MSSTYAAPANALSSAGQDTVVAASTSPRFCDKSVAQTWTDVHRDSSGTEIAGPVTRRETASADRYASDSGSR